MSRGVIRLARLGAHGACRERGPFLPGETEAGVQLGAQPLGIADVKRDQGGWNLARRVLEHDADLLDLVLEVVSAHEAVDRFVRQGVGGQQSGLLRDVADFAGGELAARAHGVATPGTVVNGPALAAVEGSVTRMSGTRARRRATSVRGRGRALAPRGRRRGRARRGFRPCSRCG